MKLLNALNSQILVFDGGKGTYLSALDIPKDDFKGHFGLFEILNLSRPDIIQKMHEDYFSSAAHAAITNTFNANPLKLKEFKLQDKCDEINKKGVEAAKKAAKRFKDRFVIGSISSTGYLPSSNDSTFNKISFSDLVECFKSQAKSLINSCVDGLLIETQQDILETKAAIIGCKSAMQHLSKTVPIICNVTYDKNGRMLMGTPVESVVSTLADMPIHVLGVNCSTGPKHMEQIIKYLSAHSPFPIACSPNAGLPVSRNKKAYYPLRPEDFAESMKQFVKNYKIRIAGGCCGTTPKHIAKLAQAISGLTPNAHPSSLVPSVSSLTHSVSLDQEPKPFIIGERLNASGSRHARELLARDDYDSLVNLAREQEQSGAHAIDVSVAHNDLKRSEEDYMSKIIRRLSNTISAPLCFDTVKPDTIKFCLENYPGKAIVNSINLERSTVEINKTLKAVKTHGAAIIALTIDKKGMALTCQRKVDVVRKLYKTICQNHKIAPHNLIIDPLTFPIATGDKKFSGSAKNTLEAIKIIKKEFPKIKLLLGVSNVSFGVKKDLRKVLNSVFLYHALTAGLDMAIIDAAKIVPYSEIPKKEKAVCEDLIFNTRPDALERFISLQTEIKKEKPTAKNLSIEDEIRYKVIHRDKTGIQGILDQALKEHRAEDIIRIILIPAMKEVGDKFGKGELILPFVLESAEVMKKCMNHLDKFIKKKDSSTIGTLVLATVYGDVHDIGKNLLKTLLENNGWRVVDLGKQVPAKKIVESAKKEKADAIGLSALLVSTSEQMRVVVEMLAKEKLKIPVLVGGAAVNSRFAKEISKIKSKDYSGGVYYGHSAFSGLKIMNELTTKSKVKNATKLPAPINKENSPQIIKNSKFKPLSNPPKPPFMGTKIISNISLARVLKELDHTFLYKVQWGVRGLAKKEYEKIINKKFRPLLDKLKEECIKDKILEPKSIYGFFNAKSSGNKIFVYDKQCKKLTQFVFARQKNAPYLCIADYFNSTKSSIMDILPVQIVTMGKKASRVIKKYNDCGEFSKALYLHGLSVMAAESLAQMIHQRIKKELGITSGERYSFGYPACPELSQQKPLLSLLGAGRIGVKLSSGFQMIPEQSTSAIIVHHPKAKYFFGF